MTQKKKKKKLRLWWNSIANDDGVEWWHQSHAIKISYKIEIGSNRENSVSSCNDGKQQMARRVQQQ